MFEYILLAWYCNAFEASLFPIKQKLLNYTSDTNSVRVGRECMGTPFLFVFYRTGNGVESLEIKYIKVVYRDRW